MCNLNIQNNILNWLNSEIKRYEKILKCRAQWEKTLKRAGNFNWWTYNSIKI